MIEEIIQARNVSKFFKNVNAVNDLSFSVQKGDVYGFLGQNGAGKSTMIRMLLTLVKPSKGNIQFFRKDLSTNRIDILKRIGAVIEKPDVYKYLSAYQNLSLFAKLSGINPSRNILMDELHRVGLAGRENDKVKTYSQGMKQRLGIAIALIHNPEIIILDEPTNGLDPQGIADIRNLILHLHREKKKTILISSHLLSEIEQVATRILIIDKGRKLVEEKAAILLDPANTVIEIKTENIGNTLLKMQESQWNQYIQASSENVIKLKMHKKNVPGLHQWMVQNGIEVMSLIPRHSLEDLFLQVTSGKNYVEAI